MTDRALWILLAVSAASLVGSALAFFLRREIRLYRRVHGR